MARVPPKKLKVYCSHSSVWKMTRQLTGQPQRPRRTSRMNYHSHCFVHCSSKLRYQVCSRKHSLYWSGFLQLICVLLVLLYSDIAGYPSWRQQRRCCALGFNHCWRHWTADYTARWPAAVGAPDMMYNAACGVFHVPVCCCCFRCETAIDVHSCIWQLFRSLLNNTAWNVFAVKSAQIYLFYGIIENFW